MPATIACGSRAVFSRKLPNLNASNIGLIATNSNLMLMALAMSMAMLMLMPIAVAMLYNGNGYSPCDVWQY